MRTASVLMHGTLAGFLMELEPEQRYCFVYSSDYHGEPVSLILPVSRRSHVFTEFPPFFEGMLPEGFQLAALLEEKGIAANDLLSQLIAVGGDLVGAITIGKVD